MRPETTRANFGGIQVLRLAAALLVVGTHTTFYAQERLDKSFPVWHFGEVGVDIFFVISGFVMMASSHRNLGAAGFWKAFAARRIIRIVPMYWLATTLKVLSLIAVPAAVLHAQLTPGTTILSYFFLPSRNADGTVEPLLGVGWTLTFEMFFYLVFAAALLVRANVMWTVAVVMTACSVGMLFRPDNWAPALVYLNSIVLYFLIGMVVARWTLERKHGPAIRWLAYGVIVWAVIAAFRNGFGHFDWSGFLRPVLVTAVVVAVVLLEPALGEKYPKILISGGDASYTLYLFHPLIAPIVPVILAHFGLRLPFLSVGVSFIVVLVAAAVIYRLVESPITALLQKNAPFVRWKSAEIVQQVAVSPDQTQQR